MMRNLLTILAVCALPIMASCATSPATGAAIEEGVKYAKAKADCEAAGKDYKCATGMADCQCVERPTPPPPPPIDPKVQYEKDKADCQAAGKDYKCATGMSDCKCVERITPPPPPLHTSFSYSKNEYYEMDVSKKANWRKGKISFAITKLSFAELPRGKDGFLFMAKLKSPSGKESNFHYNIADLAPRLITQRFDGTCPGHCERQDIGNVHWNPAETYQFVFEWDETKVSCLVTDAKGGKVYEGVVPTFGPYAGADWIRVGNGVFPPYPAVSNNITVINPRLE